MQPVIVVMGVSGTGKSTVARLLAERLNWDFEEGDDLHPDPNIAKMKAGIPLTDEDRAPWLGNVAAWIRAHERAGRPGVVPCSALKRAYRDRLRGEHVVFVHLVGSPELIAERMSARAGHFMPPSLLTSQLDTLEPPGADEQVLTVDIGRPVPQLVDEVIARLGPAAASVAR